MKQRKRRGGVNWQHVAAYRRPCPSCGAVAGQGCRNYKGQRKAACDMRVNPPKPEALPEEPRGPVQRTFFPVERGK